MEQVLMPNTMTSEDAARRERERVTELQRVLNTYPAKFAKFGVEITTPADFKTMTPDYITKGIAKQRDNQLVGKFIPPSIRTKWQQEFADMEANLIPLARDLQEFLKSANFTIRKDDTTNDFYFDSEEVEAYIAKASTVEIPKTIRVYFAKLQEFCAAYEALKDWCLHNRVTPPTMRLFRSLSGESRYVGVPTAISGQEECKLQLSPELMFKWYSSGLFKIL